MTTKPTGGDSTAAPIPPAPDGNAVATARSEALAYALEVNDLCQIAGVPQRAKAFIEAETPVADIRKALASKQAADADEDEISGLHAPVRSGRFSLAASMRRRVGLKEA